MRDNFPIYYGLIERHLRFFPGALIIITLRGKTHLAGCCDQSQDVRSCKEKSNAVHVTPRIKYDAPSPYICAPDYALSFFM